MIWLRLVYLCCLLLCLSCSTTAKKPKQTADFSDDDNFADDDTGSYGSSSTLVMSLGRNSYSSSKISMTKINSQIDRLSSKQRPTIKDLEKLIHLQAVSRQPFWEIWQNAQKLSRLIQGNRGVSDNVKLDLSMAALRSGKYAIAEYFLGPLASSSRIARVKAGANNAIGVMYLLEGKHQEASIYFKKALGASSGYPPSVLNLGLLQLRFGDFANARRTLNRAPANWFVNSSMIIIERHLGKISQASALCNRVLTKKANDKMTKVNCAIIELKENKNYKKARKLLQDAAKISGGGGNWENMIYKLLEEIDNKEFNKQLQASVE